jgi:hypothetical protein
MYIVISKPKRKSQAAGVVQVMAVSKGVGGWVTVRSAGADALQVCGAGRGASWR